MLFNGGWVAKSLRRFPANEILILLAVFSTLWLTHLPFLRLPYYWDEAGYYVPASWDFYHAWALIPTSTPPSGHTPLVMILVGLAWRVFGCSPLVTRSTLLMLAAANVAALNRLGRQVASREAAFWSALLLAISPVFFAQSTLLHLDLAAALFTTLAVLALGSNRHWSFAVAAALAILSKETAVVLLPIAWLVEWRRRRGIALAEGVALVAPLLPLLAWACYYHHATGFWTGNREYLSYNVYATLSPARFFFSLLRRGYELFIGGFHWLLTAAALVSISWERKPGRRELGVGSRELGKSPTPFVGWNGSFALMATGLIAANLFLLSAVGGAILPRYLLPVFPLFYLIAAAIALRLPRLAARLLLAAAACGFVAAWFINPPYPFPFEDNVAYADFIRLHQQAAHYLESQPGEPRILTAWPATDELTKPLLGYVQRPLQAVAVPGFAPQELGRALPRSFDLLYFYSRKWEPANNWTVRFPAWLRLQGRYFDYYPQISEQDLVARFHLQLLAAMELRGQWVRIYRATP